MVKKLDFWYNCPSRIGEYVKNPSDYQNGGTSVNLPLGDRQLINRFASRAREKIPGFGICAAGRS